MRTSLLPLLLTAILFLGGALVRSAFAQPAPPTPGSAITAGSGLTAGSGSSAADQLPEPLEHPTEAISDWKLAQKTGWPLAILCGLVMLTHGLAYLKTTSIGAWLQIDSRASIISACGTILAAAYNTVIAGGTWVSAAIAAAGAFALLKSPQPRAATVAPAPSTPPPPPAAA